MAEGQTYNIPAMRYDWFKARLETLGKKAKKLNGERLFCTVIGFHNEEDKTSKFFGQKIMEVFVACPEPKLAGWEFIARIDHAHEVGNLIRTTGLRNLPEVYRERGPVCDHCGHKRQRRDTFVVFSEEHGFKQVGSSCLKDFLGHGDADRIAKLAELLSNIHSFMRGSYDAEGGLQERRWIQIERYLEQTAEIVLTEGFVSKKQAFENGRESTAEKAFVAYNSPRQVSEQAKSLAAKALEWAQNLDETEEQPLNDYLHNAWVIANTFAIEARSTGIAASIVGVYARNQRPKQSVSEHVGVVGEKISTEVIVDEVRTLANSFMHKMRDERGNRFTWFASKPLLRDNINKIIRIRGVVKQHDDFRGIKQTILTRVNAV